MTEATVRITTEGGGGGQVNLGFGSQIQAEREATGEVSISWSAPPAVAANVVAQFQIWRSASPFTLIGTVTGDAREFRDTTALPGKLYAYTVTYLLAGASELLDLGSQFVPEEAIPAAAIGLECAQATESDEPGRLRLLPLALGLLAVLVLGALVTVAVLSKNPDDPRPGSALQRNPPTRAVFPRRPRG